MAFDENDCFKTDGLSTELWPNAAPMRDIFKAVFQLAGVPYYSPHTFRHMLVQIAYQRKLTPAHLKARSQNLGHESLLISLTSHGNLPLEMPGQLIMETATIQDLGSEMADAMDIARMLRTKRKVDGESDSIPIRPSATGKCPQCGHWKSDKPVMRSKHLRFTFSA